MNLAKFINSCKSYNDFKIKTSKLKNKGNWVKSNIGKDVCFEFLTKILLLSSPYFKNYKIKNVWHESEIPLREKQLINYPVNISDEGIDLLVKTQDNKYFTVQCKFRSNNKETLTLGGKGGLSTFLNLSNETCHNIDKNIVFATVNNPPKKTKLIPDKCFFILENFLTQLDNNNYSEWKRIKNFLLKKQSKIKKIKKLPFQKIAIKHLKNHFLSESRGCLFLPCGTGKTLISYWFANTIKAKKIIILVPNLSLISQVLKTWVEQGIADKHLLNWLIICSDKDVSLKEDPFTISTFDLPFESTTNVKNIENFFKRNTNDYFVISTYNSSFKISEIAKKNNLNFDLCIFDEAHRTVGTKDKLFSKLLFNKNIKIKKRLFMTATKREVKNFKDIIDMNDETIYGKPAYEMSFKAAIESNNPILCDYNFISLGISKSSILDLWKQNPKVRHNKEPDATTMRYLCCLILLYKVVNKHKLKKGITFHNTISGSENFKEIAEIYQKYLNANNDFIFFNISSKMSSSGNKYEILRDFEKDKKSIITNARCLVEGVDVPAVDFVMFADKKSSKVDIVQSIGRCLRKSKGKKIGYVIVPYVYDDKEKKENFLKTEYKDILTTIRQLALYDKTFHEEMKIIRKNKFYFSKKVTCEILNEDKIISIDKLNQEIKIINFKNVGPLNWLSYYDAKKYVQDLNIQKASEYRIKYKNRELDEDLPAAPDQIYKNEGFTTWRDFLGTSFRSSHEVNETVVDFENFIKILRSLNLKFGKDFYKIPHDKKVELKLPSNPERYYKEFNSWGLILNTGYVATFNRKYKSLDEVKSYLHPLQIPSASIYNYWITGNSSNKGWSEKYLNKVNTFISKLPKPPNDLPIGILGHYSQKGKINITIDDLLGTSRSKTKDDFRKYRKVMQNRGIKLTYRNYKKAKSFVNNLELWKQKTSSKSLGVGIFNKWHAYVRNLYKSLPELPADIPTDPVRVYAHEWISWKDWIGTNFFEFDKFKKYIKKLKLINYKLPTKYFVKNKKGKSLFSQYGKYRCLYMAYVNNDLKGIEDVPPQIPKVPQSEYKEHKPFSYKDIIC